VERVASESLFGWGARWVGRHPVWAGVIAGSVVVGIATARVPGVFVNSPGNALILSALVIGVWAGLTYMMRSFFERQGYVEEETTRRVVWEDDEFVWSEGDEVLLSLKGPSARLERPAGSEGAELRSEDAHPIWIVVDGEKVEGTVEAPLRLETKITAGEAVNYDVGEGEADDEVPLGHARKLLERVGERRLGGEGRGTEN